MSRNPYLPPNAAEQSLEQPRSSRQLACPQCHLPSHSPGRAVLGYPVLKLKCSQCGARSRVSLSNRGALKFAVLWTVPMVCGLTELGVLANTNPFQLLENTLVRYFPGVWQFLSLQYGVSAPRVLVALFVMLAFLVPFLKLAHFTWIRSVRLFTADARLRLVSAGGEQRAREIR